MLTAGAVRGGQKGREWGEKGGGRGSFESLNKKKKLGVQ